MNLSINSNNVIMKTIKDVIVKWEKGKIDTFSALNKLDIFKKQILEENTKNFYLDSFFIIKYIDKQEEKIKKNLEK